MNQSNEQAAASDNAPWLSYVELFVLSAVSLYLELLVIRWMSADIRAFSVFRTFPLVTCFVGLGVGYALGRDRLLRLAPVGLLLFVLSIKLAEYTGISWFLFPSMGIFNWQDVNVLQQNLVLYLTAFMLILILLLSGPFLAMLSIGSRLGVLFNRGEPLRAYCINIGGAIVGSLLFSLTAFTGMGPAALLIPVVVALFYYLWKAKVTIWQIVLPLVISVVLAAVTVPAGIQSLNGGVSATYWSPYQRIDISPLLVKVQQNGKDVSVNLGSQLCINRIFYQFVLDLSADKINPPGLSDTARKTLQEFRGRYLIPYVFGRRRDVLVVGAGTGNDVAEALRQGAASVDAVDIDPVILRLGSVYNPAHPYEDPRTRRICDDARHYFNTSKKHYDLIVFGHLDSQSVTSNGSSMRLDNYVYTSESLKQALRLLKPDGLLVLSFASLNNWIPQRLYWTIRDAAGYAPIVIKKPGNWGATIYVAGEPVRNRLVTVPSIPQIINPAEVEDFASTAPVRILTDDWPYLYLRPVGLDIPYLLIIAEVLALSAFAGRSVLFTRSGPFFWQMFFLGGGFLLLELQSIARLALLYGSTWLTSAIVINGVLVMILGANILVLKARQWMHNHQHWLYALLFLSLLSSYLLPVQDILSAGGSASWSAQFLITAITLLPMFMAGTIFATAFGGTPNAGRALGFNLLGAVIGAMLEYLSNFWGIKSLVLVALFLYLCSWLCFQLQAKANHSQQK